MYLLVNPKVHLNTLKNTLTKDTTILQMQRLLEVYFRIFYNPLYLINIIIIKKCICVFCVWKYYLRLLTFFDCMFIQFVQLSGIKFCKLRDKNPQISEEEEKKSCNSLNFSLYDIVEHGFNWNYLNTTSVNLKCYIIYTALPNCATNVT